MSSTALDPLLFHDAMQASGEPLPLPKRLSYRVLFGADWRYSLLGYAYLRCVDDIVDSAEDPKVSLELMAEQREFIDKAYGGTLVEEEVIAPARYGLAFFAWDRENGAPLRPHFEAFLDTMEFDIRRRHKVPSAAELDNYVLTTGHAFLRCMVYFATGKQELPDSCLDLGSCAYLCADALMDLEEDLEVGLINFSDEIVAKYHIDLESPYEGLERWKPVRVAEILEFFDQARATIPSIGSLPMRILYRHFLARKKRRFLRFLSQTGQSHLIG
jgi:phytoene/squalene synthetase